MLDPRPLEPGEPESVPRAPRKRKGGRRRAAHRDDVPEGERKPTYAELGRAVIDRVIELGREAGEAVASADSLRRDAKENKAARIEAEQRASRLFERVKELEAKLEMAEGNLRTVLAAARGRGASVAPATTEMEALLRILKSPSEVPGAEGESVINGQTAPESQEAAGE